MSTPFYDLASLVVVPSGYKSGKIYAQKPLTTDGQLTFTRASTATRVNASGLIESVASGVPRLDYTNSSCPKLLLEPQRTNLVTYSEQFDNASWQVAVAGSANVTRTANATTAPDGTSSADLISLNRSATSEIACLYRGTSTGAGTFKGSIWLKAKDSSNVGKTIDVWSWEGTTRGYTKITLTANWVRYEQATTVFVGTGAELFDFGLLPDAYSTSTTLAVEFYAWGAQSEAGAYATSYIPTTSAAVTRLADACSKTGISSLIGQTEGTFFVDFVWKGHFEAFQQITIGTNANRLGIYTYDVTNTLRWFVIASGSSLFELNISSALVIGQRYKLAIAYKTGDLVVYINGSQTFASSAPLTFNGALNDVYFDTGGGTSKFTQPISQTLLFKTRLTNAQLAELTAL